MFFLLPYKRYSSHFTSVLVYKKNFMALNIFSTSKLHPSSNYETSLWCGPGQGYFLSLKFSQKEMQLGTRGLNIPALSSQQEPCITRFAGMLRHPALIIFLEPAASICVHKYKSLAVMNPCMASAPAHSSPGKPDDRSTEVLTVT